MNSFQIREIKIEDNLAVANIIRKVMTEFDCVGEGYSINDPEVDDMFAAYENKRSIFYVIENEKNKTVLGCGGIAPLKNAPSDTCELQKMYFLPQLRGHGMGHRLLEICLGSAIELGFKECYLETTNRMTGANKLYQKNGFKKLQSSEGNTGHGGCDAYYKLSLNTNTPFKNLLK